jgi:phenylalanine-4-hydroxylase
MRSHYRIDDFQQNYFVVSSMEQLLKVTVETDFAPLYERLESLPDIVVGEIIAEDALITKGTQAYFKGYQVPKSPGG